MSRTRNFCFALLALALVGSAQADPRDGQGPERRRPHFIRWSPGEIRDAVLPAETATYTATFTSNQDMDNLELRLTPGLARFATVDMPSIAHVTAHTPVSVLITLEVPALPVGLSEYRDAYAGLLLMRAGGRQVPTALRLRFHRIEPDPAGDVATSPGR